MGVVKRLHGLDEDGDRFLRVEPALVEDVFAEVGSIDELHGEVMGVVGLAPFVKRDNVGMVEPGGVGASRRKRSRAAGLSTKRAASTFNATTRLRSASITL